MIKIRHFIAIFVPALLVLGLAIFVRVLQYQPINPTTPSIEQQNIQAPVPIFPDDPILGNKKAQTTIITFEDFGCEGCRQQMDLLEQILEKYPDKIKIVWKGLPVTRFPYSSQPAHEYAFCANRQNKFIEFQKIAFNNFDNLSVDSLNQIVNEIGLNIDSFEKCLTSGEAQDYIKQIENLGLYFNIQSVPTIFMNNKQIQPPQILEGWETLLNL